MKASTAWRPALFALLFGLACPEHTESSVEPGLTPCAKVGQRCQFAPGKLGSCVFMDGCKLDNCFVCQSQH